MENIQILYNVTKFHSCKYEIHVFHRKFRGLFLIICFLQIGRYQTGMHPQTLHQALLYQVKEYYNLWMV